MPERIATVGNMEAAGRDPSNPGNYVGGEQRRVLAGLTPSEPRANHHPTVKSVALCRWLVRLVTPPNGILLDCFAGSGSIAMAATLEWFDSISIEQDPEYAEIARRRIAHVVKHGERWLEVAAISKQRTPIVEQIAEVKSKPERDVPAQLVLLTVAG